MKRQTKVVVILLVAFSSIMLEQTHGQAVRRSVSWKVSRVKGSPEPPAPYRVEVAFPKLKFNRPVVLTSGDGTNTLFVAEQGGKILSFENRADVAKPHVVADIKKLIPKATTIYGFEFDPDFGENQFIYVCYIDSSDKPTGTRVARFQLTKTEPRTVVPDSHRLIITWPSGGHNGGCIKFGPDGYLYITTGDGAGPSPPDTLKAGQDVSNLLSAILRIDVSKIDERIKNKNKTSYVIPSDNPFIDLKEARGEIWSYGYRNPWKMSFDSKAGDLWVGDVGWELWEMVYKVRRGGNYGWSVTEGPQLIHPEGKRGPTPILSPTVTHAHSEAASITGGFVYRGKRLPDLVGRYVYGDYQSGKVWALNEKDGRYEPEEIANTTIQLVAFGTDPDGELYLVDHNGTKQIYKLVTNTKGAQANTSFPRKLSETRLFHDVASHEPEEGVLPYDINAHAWEDHAITQRLMALPGTEPIKLDNKGNWDFPEGSVIAKTISLEMNNGDVRSRKRIETQLLHREAGSWHPYTYAWNKQQTDATLVQKEGMTRKLIVRDKDSPGGERVVQHRFAGRAECKLCHNPWVAKRTTIFGDQTASLLSVNAQQLDKENTVLGKKRNQIEAFHALGLLSNKVARPKEPFVDPYDSTEQLVKRVKSYFHVNCSHCHQFNAGGATTILLSHNVDLQKAKLIDAKPSQGSFGIANARIVKAGQPHRSVLYYRLAKRGGGRMPRAGAKEVDVAGLKLIGQWIQSLGESYDPSGLASKLASSDSTARKKAIRSALSTTTDAIQLLRLLDGKEAKSEELVQEIVNVAKSHGQTEIRDLFERFVPEEQRIKRLGETLNIQQILELSGDAKAGHKVFRSNTAGGSCINCHRVGKEGKSLGPDLDNIAKKYRRDELLTHILEPSRRVDKEFISFLVETDRGRVYSGLVKSNNAKEIVLRDSKDNTIRIPKDEVERIAPQQKSLMPELLLRDMTAQQVADLIAYMSTLK